MVNPIQSSNNAGTPVGQEDGATVGYQVRAGDTLWDLARRFGVSLADLIAANPQIADPDRIIVGQRINVPEGGAQSYVVRSGDNLSQIAARFGTTVEQLARDNGIDNPDRIYPGDVLRIAAATTSSAAPEPAASTPDPSPVTTPVQPAPTGKPYDYQGIANVQGNANVTPQFIGAVEAMAQRLGTRPEYLMAVMSFESGLRPAAVNPLSGATGLIQFIPDTAAGLGTSTAALRGMSAMQQLPYVEAYFNQYRGQLGTLEGVYTAVLSGRAQPDPSAVLFRSGTIAYAQNRGLDFDRDGRITGGEATQAVAARLYGGVSSVQQRLLDSGVVPAAQRAGFVDGELGPQTAAAIARFQSAQGLPSTGLLDERTGSLLSGRAVSSPPPADSAPAPLTGDGSLRRGAEGGAVKTLQDDLQRLNLISRASVNTGYGTFGPATESALQSFQRSVGLSPSGVVDQATARAIESIMGGVGSARNPNADVIRATQAALSERGLLSASDRAAESGAFGPRTEAALREFQSAAGIGQTGVLGLQTYAALLGSGAGGSGSWPVPGHRTINRADKPGEGEGEFGSARSGGRQHRGIDINAPVGSRVESFRAGEVIFAGQMSGYGNTVIVQHANGLQTVYAHLQRISVGVGDSVTDRTQVGTVGRSGNTPSTGDSHLHFEVRENASGVLTGTAVDPRRYLQIPN